MAGVRWLTLSMLAGSSGLVAGAPQDRLSSGTNSQVGGSMQVCLHQRSLTTATRTFAARAVTRAVPGRPCSWP